jgi:tetratricopeptide (TPR) repeat protein
MKFLEENPEDAFLLFALAQEYARLGSAEEAIVSYQRLLTLHPDYVASYYHLAKLQVILGKTEDAVHTYTKGMEVALGQGDHHAHGELQMAYQALLDSQD